MGREIDEVMTKKEVIEEAHRVLRQEAGIDVREMVYPMAGGGAPIGIDDSRLEIEKQGVRRGASDQRADMRDPSIGLRAAQRRFPVARPQSGAIYM
jgi:hypothetical protein